VRVLGGFWAFVLQFGAQRVDLGGEESILARIWLCFGRIWRADERGKARASGPAGWEEAASVESPWASVQMFS